MNIGQRVKTTVPVRISTMRTGPLVLPAGQIGVVTRSELDWIGNGPKELLGVTLFIKENQIPINIPERFLEAISSESAETPGVFRSDSISEIVWKMREDFLSMFDSEGKYKEDGELD